MSPSRPLAKITRDEIREGEEMKHNHSPDPVDNGLRPYWSRALMIGSFGLVQFSFLAFSLFLLRLWLFL
jgi:hypothetical protein